MRPAPAVAGAEPDRPRRDHRHHAAGTDRNDRPAALLLVAGEKAHSRYYTEDAYRQAPEPKELHIVAGSEHVDLYDRVDLIPWNRLTGFFDQNL